MTLGRAAVIGLCCQQWSAIVSNLDTHHLACMQLLRGLLSLWLRMLVDAGGRMPKQHLHSVLPRREVRWPALLQRP